MFLLSLPVSHSPGLKTAAAGCTHTHTCMSHTHTALKPIHISFTLHIKIYTSYTFSQKWPKTCHTFNSFTLLLFFHFFFCYSHFLRQMTATHPITHSQWERWPWDLLMFFPVSVRWIQRGHVGLWANGPAQHGLGKNGWKMCRRAGGALERETPAWICIVC